MSSRILAPVPTGIEHLSKGDNVTPRFIDWIWHVRGSVALPAGETRQDAFDKLLPLFGEPGTSYERAGDMLTFRKKDAAAQDKMSVFNHGVLQIEHGETGPVLRYHLVSRILLFCFLAPLLFVAFAQLAVFVGKLEKPAAEATAKSDKPSDGKHKAAAKKEAEVPMNPIDKALGAPAPEKPKKDGDEKAGRRNKKPTATPGYVFAAFFAILYVVGRILEDRLVKRLFQKRLAGS